MHAIACCGRRCRRACLDSAEYLSTDDIVGAPGEIANMVVGAVERRIQCRCENIDICIPSLLEGRQLSSRLGEGTVKTAAIVRTGNEHSAALSPLYQCSKRQLVKSLGVSIPSGAACEQSGAFPPRRQLSSGM